MKYQLTMTEKQAAIVAEACEFLCRIKLGQFGEIIWKTLIPQDIRTDDFCDRRDAAEDLLYKAREHIFPELHGRGHSYSVGKFEDADLSFGVYEVIRHALGRGDGPYLLKDVPTIKTIDETRSANGLDPCPFCGGPAQLYRQKHVPEGYDWTPRCIDTSCAGRLTKKYSTKEAAIAKWNRRT